MSEQAKKIAGYRVLSEGEIGLLNEIKALEAKFNGLIDKLRSVDGIDQRSVEIASTEGESTFMRAVRAVAMPERISN